jgi:hypothetical protein
MIDLLYLTHNRLEFTQVSVRSILENTNWSLVNEVWVYEDRSIDGTRDFIEHIVWPVRSVFCAGHFGAPAAVMSHFLGGKDSGDTDIFCKLDNDVIVPPGWLDAAWGVMERSPELDLLGLEPPASRVPRMSGMAWSKTPELNGGLNLNGHAHGYAPCDSIGGIGLMRRKALVSDPNGRLSALPHSKYSGFTEWQLGHPMVKKGWIAPPIRLFLLDRMPTEPWASLSRKYIQKGWQRPWNNYSLESAPLLWEWAEELLAVHA